MKEIILDMGINGLDPGEIIADGKHHRFSVGSDDHKKNGWYKAYQNFTRKTGEVFYVVLYGNHKTQEDFKFVSGDIKFSAEDKKHLKAQMEKASAEVKAEKLRHQEQVSHDVTAKWESLPEVGESDYLKRKLISECPNLGIRFASQEGFYVPLRDVQGKLWSVQKIQADGGKFFFPGGRVEECFHVIGDLDGSDTIRISEGCATAASIHLATGFPIVVAFNAGNLVRVAKVLKGKYPDKSFVIYGDDDLYTTRIVDGNESAYNPGREKAEDAAKACLGYVVFPVFKEPKKGLTDFNDLHVVEGLDQVKEQCVKAKIERQFIVPLGFKGNEYFFTSSSNRQVVGVQSINEETLSDLMPFEFWESMFPGAGKAPVNWTAARFSLKGQCRAKGIFQARNVRGTGVWRDEKRSIVNMGDYLSVDRNRNELSEIKSRYFYTLSSTMSPIHDSPLTADECNLLIDACSTFKWLKDDFGFMLIGWLVISRICGALPIRPHMWLTGAASTGKTTLLEKLISPILGHSVLYVQGATTEAGIRQSLGADAVPVIFDEFESTGQKSGENIASCIELMRAAWSDSSAQIIKGGSSGNAMSFQVHFCAFVSSIRVKLNNDADKTRFTQIELAPHGSDPVHWKRLSGLLDQITLEYGDRLFARTINLIPVLLDNFKVIKKVLSARSSQRFGDQYGMLLAGYSVLLQDEALTEKEAIMLVDNVRLSEQKEESKIADHDDALTQLKTKRVALNCRGDKKMDLSVFEAIEESRKDDGTLKYSLLAIGIRVETDKVVVAGHSHSELENLVFRNTQWSKAWINSLARLDGAIKKHGRVGGFTGVTVEIPIINFK